MLSRGLPMWQEREARGEKFLPRWFKPTPGAPVFESEHPEDTCPLWEFTGDYYTQPKRPAQPDGAHDEPI